ncbi:branched-chain amino acid aminotransferase/4-amino-4-deoxychorismate lyase [Cenarchaeum symbiosum A]|uniref:Branched-chain-amino-acid aminotransferase n=1 Tax=Cenarchaeum symbiosum (strain A) TaxID=414004 RepID=A0RYB2_CENSY|nr:branched-chain amino acid aminotransferase/4-amino-4-deoxychorismate lyase [Cenarchaeum symbiosum A]
MGSPRFGLIWFDGKFVPVDKPLVTLTTHAIHYGTSAFEGIRAYWDSDELRIFRLRDHVRRLRRSGAYYSMRLRYTDRELMDGMAGLCRRNRVKESCYIRPFYFVGEHGINLHVTRAAPTHVAMLVLPLRDIFDKGGISAEIVGRRKFSDLSTPVQAKMGGNYLNSIIATQEAKRGGFDEAILLDHRGDVSEAPGENIFVVKGGRLHTPPSSSSALDGITRDTVMRLAEDLGYSASARRISKERLLGADEVFLTGTAAEIVPVVRIGKKRIGRRPGPITEELMQEYQRTVAGRNPRYSRWLTGVYG